jgi:hypothetical protein
VLFRNINKQDYKVGVGVKFYPEEMTSDGYSLDDKRDFIDGFKS